MTMPTDSHSTTAPFPSRARLWRVRGHDLLLHGRPLLMGIINVTPDSFSDGGAHFDHHAAIAYGMQLVQDGCDALDVGGESTRPGATPVDETEELRRVIDVVVGLAAATQIPISIDTSKACVAREAMAAGAAIVNDVTGLEADAEMVRVVREGEAGVVVMHMQGTPQTMQLNPTYENVVTEVREYLARRRDALVAAGIQSERIALDPGIGFGKTHEHNLSLLRHAGEFHQLGCPLLVGHSRKGFLAKVLGRKDSDRTAATIGVALALASQGVQILRVHDVRPVREALLLYDAVGGINGWETRWQ